VALLPILDIICLLTAFSPWVPFNSPSLDTIAVTSLETCDTHSDLACHWVAQQPVSPFVALSRGAGVGVPADAVLSRVARLVDINGDGLSDILVGVSADDRVRVSARRPQVLKADGRGGFSEAVSAPEELWSLPVAIGRHAACEAPVLFGSEGLAMFGVDPSYLALCAETAVADGRE
jgi:hypothetical protein